MTKNDTKPLSPHMRLVAEAMRVKIATDLGYHRLARRALTALIEQAGALRPEVHTKAAAQPVDDDELCLGDLLERRYPPRSYDEQEADHVTA